MARTFKGDPNAIAKILEARIRAKLKSLELDDKVLKKAFLDIGNLIATQAKVNITRQGLIDSGLMRERTEAKFIEPGLMHIGVFGLPYARIHEFGGTITPKNVQWLTIPTKPFKNLTARGVPGLFFVQKSANKAFLFQKRGSGAPVLAFNLRKSVDIPPRPYLAPAITQQRDRAIEILTNAVRQNLGGN